MEYCISGDAIDVIADAIARVRATLLSLVGLSCNSVWINACTVARCRRIISSDISYYPDPITIYSLRAPCISMYDAVDFLTTFDLSSY